MKESFNSLRLLFLFVGLLGGLSLVIIGIDGNYAFYFTSPLSAISLVLNLVSTLTLLYLAATLHTLLPAKKHLIQGGLILYGLYILGISLYNASITGAGINIGFSTLISLVIFIYLIVSIERLSREFNPTNK